jgi:2,4-dienoyl-CoA reductase (NADPH2)
MTETAYPRLFSPLRLGAVTVPNRIVFAAHLTNYAQDGLPSEQHAAYYAARAAGGAGLIITEEHVTHRNDWPYEKVIKGYRPEVVAGYRRVTEAVHAHGVPILAQLSHNGGQSSSMYSRLPVWSPSGVPDPLFREVPKAVDHREIAEIVAGFRTVAGHCVAGGFDGVELQCSHASIVREFLSPVTNLRTDEYGGPELERRARLLTEIAAAVREALGPDRILGVRLCVDELIDGGIGLADTVATARLLERAGLVDYINTSIGVATRTLHMVQPSMAQPRGHALPHARAIREAVSLPVVGIGRIKEPDEAENALAEGLCDLVGMVRGQIADPEFAVKARTGAREQIRVCLSCNQECSARVGMNRWLGCLENPRAGRESVVLAPPRLRGRSVLVVGAGPGGLQAATTAAERGHRVTLLEQADEVGGQVRFASSGPARGELRQLIRNLESECRRSGVRLETGVTATEDLVLAQEPDTVVLATGARARLPWWASGSPRVVHIRDVFEGKASPSGRVLLIDEVGFHPATATAELLADRGARVRISTPAMVVGQDLGLTLDMELFTKRAFDKGITQGTDEVVTGATAAPDGGVVVDLLRHTTGVGTQERFDWVVCAVHQEPAEDLWLALRDSDGFGVHRVGDCLTPRRAHAAVVEGHRVGSAL